MTLMTQSVLNNQAQSCLHQLFALYVNLTGYYPFQDAFSLLAYSDPWNSPVGAQLDPVQREPVCAALNSAILGKIGS